MWPITSIYLGIQLQFISAFDQINSKKHFCANSYGENLVTTLSLAGRFGPQFIRLNQSRRRTAKCGAITVNASALLAECPARLARLRRAANGRVPLELLGGDSSGMREARKRG
jgi:hypothetical protein